MQIKRKSSKLKRIIILPHPFFFADFPPGPGKTWFLTIKFESLSTAAQSPGV